MKKLSFMLVAVAAVAFSFTSCKDGGNDPIVGPITCDTCSQVDPEPEPAEIPEVAAPEEGYVTFVISIPEGSECNGIAFKGTRNGSWSECSGKNTYVGEDAENVGPDACIKFEKIADTKNWFKATYKLGAEAWGEDGILFAGKICLIYTDDESWEGQAKEWEYIDEYTTADHSTSGDGNIQVHATGLVYVAIAKWNKSECAEVKILPRKVTFIAPECGFETPAIVGSFGEGWSTFTPMTQVEGFKYEITVDADASDEFKIVGAEGHWDNQPSYYDVESDGYIQIDNIAFGDQTEILLDYSNGKWSACAGDDPVEE